jgi:hypothetical protein
MWKCGREGIYFNNIFCMFVKSLYRPKFGAARQFLCVVVTLCVCVCVVGVDARLSPCSQCSVTFNSSQLTGSFRSTTQKKGNSESTQPLSLSWRSVQPNWTSVEDHKPTIIPFFQHSSFAPLYPNTKVRFIVFGFKNLPQNHCCATIDIFISLSAMRGSAIHTDRLLCLHGDNG